MKLWLSLVVIVRLWLFSGSYIEQGADQLTFISSDPVGTQAIIHMGMISANISEVTRRNGSVADITTTLTIITHGLLNMTNISCITAADNIAIMSSSSSVLYFVGMFTEECVN